MAGVANLTSIATRDSIKELKVASRESYNILCELYLPPGEDSAPLPDDLCFIVDRDETGAMAVVGFLNKNSSVDPGEKRLFSRDSGGVEQAMVYLKNDGTIEFNGNAQSLVMFTPLDTALQSLVTQIQAELVKIATGIAGAGGVYVPGTLTLDISAAEAATLKTDG